MTFVLGICTFDECKLQLNQLRRVTDVMLERVAVQCGDGTFVVGFDSSADRKRRMSSKDLLCCSCCCCCCCIQAKVLRLTKVHSMALLLLMVALQLTKFCRPLLRFREFYGRNSMLQKLLLLSLCLAVKKEKNLINPMRAIRRRWNREVALHLTFSGGRKFRP